MMLTERGLIVQSQTFGKYEIIRKLSRSMTDVYLASDTETNRRVVLKLIEHSRDDFTQLVIEAERRGAQLQKQLHAIDRRIIEIYDYGEQNGCFFVAMEYFEGRTLAEILRSERRFEAKRAARYAAEICSQLQTLHAFISDVEGRKTAVVHADIKPSNVQIGAKDELRLLDFGIAKVITFTHNLTHHNLGSPSYCSPERISKAQVDQHADLWAVGVSLYEMVSGAPPYQAQNTRKLENLIQSRRPPRALPESCPAGLKAIISKALAGDIQKRYASAEAMERDLRAFEEGRAPAAEQEPFPSWDSNATIEKHPGEREHAHAAVVSRTPAPKAAQRGRRKNFTSVAIALLAGVLVGLLIFVPISYARRFRAASAALIAPRDYAHESWKTVASDFGLYQALKQQFDFLGEYSPANDLQGPVHANLMSGADNIIDSFRHSPDARLGDFDWGKAQLCLRYALKMEPSDAKTKGELALCSGYIALGDTPDVQSATTSATNFREAQSYLPRSPDPHLGLARVDVYGFHNIGAALAEFHQAEQLGYRFGPREAVEQADGYLYRAKAELDHAKRTAADAKEERARWLQAARLDIERARNLYEPISGFSNVDSDLEQVYAASSEETKLLAENAPRPAKKKRVQKRYASLRRWQ
jgi:serine/threonine protein kinase